MGIAGKIGDYAFKAFTATLGVTTIYLAATFSVNVYRGISWHNAQTMAAVSDVLRQGLPDVGAGKLHVLAIDDSHVDCKVIEKLLKISSCPGGIQVANRVPYLVNTEGIHHSSLMSPWNYNSQFN